MVARLPEDSPYRRKLIFACGLSRSLYRPTIQRRKDGSLYASGEKDFPSEYAGFSPDALGDEGANSGLDRPSHYQQWLLAGEPGQDYPSPDGGWIIRAGEAGLAWLQNSAGSTVPLLLDFTTGEGVNMHRLSALWSTNSQWAVVVAVPLNGDRDSGIVAIVNVQKAEAAFLRIHFFPLAISLSPSGCLVIDYGGVRVDPHEGAYTERAIVDSLGHPLRLPIKQGIPVWLNEGQILGLRNMTYSHEKHQERMIFRIFDTGTGVELPISATVASSMERKSDLSTEVPMGKTTAGAGERPNAVRTITIEEIKATLEKPELPPVLSKIISKEIRTLEEGGGRGGLVLEGNRLSPIASSRAPGGIVMAFEVENGRELLLARFGSRGKLEESALVECETFWESYYGQRMAFGNGAVYFLSSNHQGLRLSRIPLENQNGNGWTIALDRQEGQRDTLHQLYPLDDGGCYLIKIIYQGRMLQASRFSADGSLAWARSLEWPYDLRGGWSLHTCLVDQDLGILAQISEPDMENAGSFQDRRKSNIVLFTLKADGSDLKGIRLEKLGAVLEGSGIFSTENTFCNSQYILDYDGSDWGIRALPTKELIRGERPLAFIGGDILPGVNGGYFFCYDSYTSSDPFRALFAWSGDSRQAIVYRPEEGQASIFPKGLSLAIEDSGLCFGAFPSDGSLGGLPAGAVGLFRSPLGEASGFTLSPAGDNFDNWAPALATGMRVSVTGKPWKQNILSGKLNVSQAVELRIKRNPDGLKLVEWIGLEKDKGK